jgi:hypothetical protein
VPAVLAPMRGPHTCTGYFAGSGVTRAAHADPQGRPPADLGTASSLPIRAATKWSVSKALVVAQ